MSPIKPKHYDEAKTYTEGFEKLPAGAYVVKTDNAKIEINNRDGKNYEWLVIGFDIVEGEQAGFFKRQYDANTDENKKWKGVIRISIPGEFEAADSISNRQHKTCMAALEDSNDGFFHQWHEGNDKYTAQFKGLTVGAVFRDKEYDFEGKQGFFAECIRFADVNKVREGKVKTPEPKYLDGNAPKSAAGGKPVDNTDIDDMPI